MVRWTQAVVAVAAAALLAACGTDPATTPAGAGDPGHGEKNAATGGALFATADTETAKLKADVGPGVFPRTVTQAMGQTRIEKKPERVIVLDSGELDDVLALGVTPVGMATTAGQQGVPSYLADRVQNIATVGPTNTLDLEKIASLKPDLILGSKLRVNDLYPQLSAIAPTVFSIRPGFPWKENFLLVGAALGAEEQATKLLNEYQTKANQVKAKLTGAPTISLVRYMSGNIRLYGKKSFIGVILADIGLPRPANQNVDELAVEVSKENIDQAAGDWIFYSSYGADVSPDQKAVTEGPIWRNMSAVKAGHAIAVDDEVWFLGLGPIGAMRVLDDLGKFLG
ncbi:ABC transporter substrate-binding protein [Nocardia suismassiliense]|uniref:ABC transporter substrate-binding protein n=1 Tax=Nocardia suismassiliense TaxID=2077092 RepID=UPI000D1E125B|nr:iron-siderophore ABC transporter substrate-binding protein [Nocardia suismassiliense]